MKKVAFLQALLVFILLVGSWALLVNRFRSGDPPLSPETREAPSASNGPRSPAAGEEASGTAADPLAGVPANWREWVAYLGKQPDAPALRYALAQLRESLLLLPPTAASERLRELLESGYDRETGLAFQVAEGGQLAGAGSLRTLLLDWLGQIDPEGAAALARRELDRSGTALPPGEYVIHLRNAAWGSPAAEGAEVLATGFAALLDRQAWLENPSPPVAEAMDIPVFLGATRFVPDLARLMVPGQPQMLRHAAAIALERLIDSDPLPALEAFLGADAAGQLDARSRANLIARLDPINADSRALLRDYLRSPRTSLAEAEHFLQSFPNLNQALSHNLLSHYISNTGARGYRDRLERALSAVRDWQGEPGMERLREELAATGERLLIQMTGSPAP